MWEDDGGHRAGRVAERSQSGPAGRGAVLRSAGSHALLQDTCPAGHPGTLLYAHAVVGLNPIFINESVSVDNNREPLWYQTGKLIAAD